MSGKAEKKDGGEKLIAANPTAFHRFFIEEVVEAGLILMGTEVKSLRAQSPNLRDSFVEIAGHTHRLEAWLCNVHIAPYSHGNIWNHEPMRKRKLLLHSHQIKQMFGAVTQKGMTLVPIKMYFKKGRAKIELGLAKGKKLHDKRDTVKKRSADREMERAIKSRGRDYD